MEEKVFHILKFSYDSLGDEMIKACFLNCSLFPKADTFYQPKIINNWMAEEFLEDDGALSITAAQKGENIIRELKRACLLDSYSYERDDCFRMHDMVHDMARSICLGKGEPSDEYLVQKGLGLIEPPPIPKWEATKMISLRYNKIEILEGKPKCEKLLTLDLSIKGLKEIANDFFLYMPNLKFLDLSVHQNLRELPESLFKLRSLQFLDLSNTGIRELSPRFEKLQKLKILRLSWTRELSVVSSHVISSLTNLEQLELEGSHLSVNSINELLDELECSKALQHLKLTVRSKVTLEKLSTSEKLNQIIYDLRIEGCKGLSSLELSFLKNNQVLQSLRMEDCEDMEKVTVCWPKNDILRNVCFRDLSVAMIFNCKLLKDATLLLALPSISSLVIGGCESMEDIIGADGGGDSMVPANINPFARLTRLCLLALPLLKCICSHALPFPHLIRLHVMACPKLKRLPFDSNCGAENFEILGEREWWDGLEWEDGAIPASLNQCFKPRKSFDLDFRKCQL